MEESQTLSKKMERCIPGPVNPGEIAPILKVDAGTSTEEDYTFQYGHPDNPVVLRIPKYVPTKTRRYRCSTNNGWYLLKWNRNGTLSSMVFKKRSKSRAEGQKKFTRGIKGSRALNLGRKGEAGEEETRPADEEETAGYPALKVCRCNLTRLVKVLRNICRKRRSGPTAKRSKRPRNLLTSQIRIRVGEYDFSSVQERLPYVERGVAKKVVHPKYNFFTYEYDLALVRLESSLTFAPHISPICLPATDELLIGENATVTGWGRLSEGGTLPSVLQEVSVPIVSNDRCKSMFLKAGRHEFIPDIFLCAGYESGGQDSCQGDSGGPLQVRGKDGRYFLAGIISWGIGCAEANLPGVCTRISKFVPWILKNVT